MNRGLAELTALRDIESRLTALIRKTAADALGRLKESERRMAKVHALTKHFRARYKPGSDEWLYFSNLLRLSAEEADDDDARYGGASGHVDQPELHGGGEHGSDVDITR